MDTAGIAELLRPFLATPVSASSQAGHSLKLSAAQLDSISIYIDMLLRWNSRINLSAVRDAESIVTRHFGESLFAARQLFPAPTRVGRTQPSADAESLSADGQRPTTNDLRSTNVPRVVDLGSGAGFPGLPLKIWAPGIHLTLIESNHKKATFLREVTRALTLTDVEVLAARAEEFVPASADVVALRAVERFDDALPTASRLVAPSGRLALLISQAQLDRARQLVPQFEWSEPIPIPLSSSRILVTGHHRGSIPKA
jgi:16S rRNA (guanine527-N7)-methyltransferase